MDLKEILQKENELKDELAKLQKLKSKVTDSNIDWDMLNEINEKLDKYGVTLTLNILGELYTLSFEARKHRLYHDAYDGKSLNKILTYTHENIDTLCTILDCVKDYALTRLWIFSVGDIYKIFVTAADDDRILKETMEIAYSEGECNIKIQGRRDLVIVPQGRYVRGVYHSILSDASHTISECFTYDKSDIPIDKLPETVSLARKHIEDVTADNVITQSSAKLELLEGDK